MFLDEDTSTIITCVVDGCTVAIGTTILGCTLVLQLFQPRNCIVINMTVEFSNEIGVQDFMMVKEIL